MPTIDRPFCNPALAATYQRLCTEAVGGNREARIEAARQAWYQGFVAEAIDKFFRTEVLDASGRRHAGVMEGQDLAGWAPTIEEPARFDYHGHTMLKCGPWSQGPAFLQQLALLRGFDVGAMDPVGPDFVHTVIECSKLAFADREAFYGDPAFVDVPLHTLLSPAYNEARRGLVGAEASMALRPGAVDGVTPWVDREAGQRAEMLTRAAGVGEPTVARLGVIGADTVHIDVIDRWGNMVSATPSGGWLQSSPVVPGLGVSDGDAGADVLAARRAAEQPGAGEAAADDAFAQFRAAGRDAMDGVRDAWRGAAGPVVADLLPADGASPAWDPAGDRHAELPYRALAEQLLAADRAAGEGGAGGADGFVPMLEAMLARGHVAELGEEWSEGRLSAARVEGGVMYAGANPRGMQGYAAGR